MNENERERGKVQANEVGKAQTGNKKTPQYCGTSARKKKEHFGKQKSSQAEIEIQNVSTREIKPMVFITWRKGGTLGQDLNY